VDDVGEVSVGGGVEGRLLENGVGGNYDLLSSFSFLQFSIPSLLHLVHPYLLLPVFQSHPEA
jgi:hypothetical protein